MQKKIIASLLLVSAMSYAMEQEEQPAVDTKQVDTRGPMDPNWFYDEGTPYFKANKMADQRKWEPVVAKYEDLLDDEKGSAYDQQMACLNGAAARFAQGKVGGGWELFDDFGTPDVNRLKSSDAMRLEQIHKMELRGTPFPGEEQKTILVKTDRIGIGDIFHFLKAAEKLGKKTRVQVTLSVKGFLHKALEGAARKYNFTIKTPNEAKPQEYTFTTHLVSLLAHLDMKPKNLAPERVVLTTSEQAVGKITKAIVPYRAAKKRIAVVFLGENREATVMGGRKLRRRHLDAFPFQGLLQSCPELIIMDCNTKNHRISFSGDGEDCKAMSPEYEERVVQLPDEEEAFDTIIAMGLVANQMGTDYVGFAADNGPPNVFARALSKDAQQRTAFIIPSSDSSDMRMEGSGRAYKQLLSDCWVYRCTDPCEQSEVILGAYEDMSE